MAIEERWCVVTGGRGFAARHLVEMLIRYNMFSVRIADLGTNIELELAEESGILGEALRSGRAQYVSLDLRKKDQVLQGSSFFFFSFAYGCLTSPTKSRKGGYFRLCVTACL